MTIRYKKIQASLFEYSLGPKLKDKETKLVAHLINRQGSNRQRTINSVMEEKQQRIDHKKSKKHLIIDIMRNIIIHT